MRLHEAPNEEQPHFFNGVTSPQRFQSEPLKRSKARSSSNPDEVLMGAETSLQQAEEASKKLVMYTVV